MYRLQAAGSPIPRLKSATRPGSGESAADASASVAEPVRLAQDAAAHATSRRIEQDGHGAVPVRVQRIGAPGPGSVMLARAPAHAG